MLSDFRLRQSHRPDYFLGLLVILLVAIGMIVIYSTGAIVNFNISGGTSDRNSFFTNQAISFSVGIIGWLIASRINYTAWRSWAPWMLLASGLLMLLVFVPGISGSSRGASRWIRLGPASFQPAEFLKLSLILYVASWAANHREQ